LRVVRFDRFSRDGKYDSVQARYISTSRFILKGSAMTKSKVLSVFTFPALAVVLTYGAAAQRTASVLPKVAKVTANDPVTLTDNGDSWGPGQWHRQGHHPEEQRQYDDGLLSRRRHTKRPQ
jgi:hypothetical protein